ncbi:MAG: THUMP domain-containing protein, partial [Tannerella sp.]|nr:THUMP domain-containing protein [Tannerella sp.]
MNGEQQFEMVAKTLHGLEEVLAEELSALQAEEVVAGRRMVSFRGDKALMYRANLHCRTALRILKSVARFKANNADTVYEEVKKIEWERYFSPDSTFSVDAVIYSESFNHSRFVAYRTKDAIADYFTEKSGKRPSVRINRPDMYIHIHISHHDCTVSLDSSGESLHRRGYRTAQGEAPLNEVLAAGMILLTGWRGESDFVDPMCGSGTLLIEAAMIALNIPPGLYRREYAFEKWNDYDAELFDEIYHDDSGERGFAFKCFGSDISPAAIELARENVRNAGLTKYIELKTLPFQQYAEAPGEGILVTNPPYGERITANDILNLYRMIGERLKHVFTGYRAWILSYKESYFDNIGLRPDRKIKLMNGPLECEFHCYKLFAGTNSDYKTELNRPHKPAEKKESYDDDQQTSAKDSPFAREGRAFGTAPDRQQKPFFPKPADRKGAYDDDRRTYAKDSPFAREGRDFGTASDRQQKPFFPKPADRKGSYDGDRRTYAKDSPFAGKNRDYGTASDRQQKPFFPEPADRKGSYDGDRQTYAKDSPFAREG